jgi:hypothetical protein
MYTVTLIRKESATRYSTKIISIPTAIQLSCYSTEHVQHFRIKLLEHTRVHSFGYFEKLALLPRDLKARGLKSARYRRTPRR